MQWPQSSDHTHDSYADHSTQHGQQYDQYGGYGEEPGHQYPQEPGQRYPRQAEYQYGQQPEPHYAQQSGQYYPQDAGQYHAQQSGQRYAQEPGHQYPQDPGQRYAQEPGQYYPQEPGQRHGQDPGQYYPQDQGQRYAQEPGQRYAQDSGPYYQAGAPTSGYDQMAQMTPPRRAEPEQEHQSWWETVKGRALATSPRTRRITLIAAAGGIVAVVAERLLASPSHASNTGGMAGGGAGGAGGMAASAAPSTDGMNMADGGASPAVLAKVTQIPVGSAKIFATHKVVVTRPNAHTVKAFSAVCTHQGCVLNKVVKNKIHCPCHGGVFNLDGTVAAGPPPKPLPAASNVHVQNGKIIMSM